MPGAGASPSAGPFYPVEMWVWALPGELGMVCVEYTVEYPANVVRSTVTFPPGLVRLAGDIVGGLSLCFPECRYDWCRTAHQLLYVADAAHSVLGIGPHPDTGLSRFAVCTEGYPLEPFTVLTNLYINYGPAEPECGATAAETASWGAIKGMLD